MATRLHFPSSGTAAVSPAFQSYTHAPSTRRPATLTDATALTDLAVTPDAADHLVAGDVGVAQFVYGPIAKQTFSSGAAFKYAVQCLEANAGNNIQAQIFIGIVDGAGTARGTIRSKVAEGTEVNTSLRNVFFSGTLSGTVNAEDGDYVVIELSFTGTPSASGGVQGHNGTMRFGGNGSSGDLPENDTEAGTTFNPWIEFAATITPLTGLRRYLTTQLVPASSTVGTTFTITCTDPDTGNTFTPVAIMAHYSGRGTTGAGEATTNFGHGIATSATSRRCYGVRSVQASATSDTTGGPRDDALIAEVGAASFTGRVDVDAFLGNGFRLIVDDQLAADLLVVLEAWGGAISASVTTVTAPGATGNQDINVGLDLTGGVSDKALIFIGSGAQNATLNVASVSGAHADIGVAAGESISQWGLARRAATGAATTDTGSYMRAGEFIVGFIGTSPGIRASVTTWLSTGFRLNYAETSSGPLFFVLAIKGQRWEAGNDLTRTDTTTEKIVTAYKPQFLLVASHCTSESASDTGQDHDKSSVGVALSASSRACVSMVDTDNLADTDIAVGLHTDRIYNNFDESNSDKSTIIGAMDVSSFDLDGFTFVMDDADPSTAFFGWLTGGDTLSIYQVTTAFISSGNQRFAPAVKYVVVTGTIASGNQRFAPSVAAGAGPQSVTGGTIAAGNQRFAPTVAPGAVTVVGATIAAGNQRFAPTVAHTVAGATIASTAQLYGPRVADALLRRYLTTITIAAADTVGTTYTITCTDPDTGTTFAPVAIMCSYSGRATTGAGEQTSNWGHGIAVGPSSRFCSASRSVQGAATTDDHGGGRSDAFVAEIDSSSFTGRVDVDAFLSNGFRLIVDDQFSNDLVVVLEAWGGDFEATATTFQSPAGSGNVDVNLGLALNTGIDDKALIIIGSSSAGGAVGSIRSWTDRHDIGVVAGESIQQWCVAASAVEGAADSDTDRYMRSDQCIAWCAGVNVNVRASVTQWNADGARFNFAESVLNRHFFVLAIKGQRWQAGTDTTRTDTTPEQVLTSYRPRFLLVGSHNTTESTDDVNQRQEKVSVGYAVSTSSRACVAVVNADALADTDLAVGLFTDRIYQNFDETAGDKSTTVGAMDLQAFNNGDFFFVMDDADPSGAMFGWLIGAQTAVAGQNILLPSIGSTATLSNPTITLVQSVAGAHIASGNQRFAPTITVGAVTVVGGTIAAGNQRFPPSVAYAVAGAHIASTRVLNAPTLAYAVTTAARGSTLALFAPTITTTYAITGGTIAAGNQRFAPSVAVGAVTITGAHIGSTLVMGPPTVTTQGTISGTTVASTLVMFGPTITTGAVGITGAFIAAGNQRFAPSVARTITTAFRSSTAVLFAPTIIEEKAVTTAFRASTAQLFAPRVASGITTGTIGSGATASAPTLAYGVRTATIASGVLLFGPTLSYLQEITAEFIGSTAVLYGPGLAGGAFGGKAVITEVYVRHPVTMSAYTRQPVHMEAYTREAVEIAAYVRPEDG